MMRPGSNPFRVDMQHAIVEDRRPNEPDDHKRSVQSSPHALAGYMRFACIVLVLQATLLCLITIACIMATHTAYSMKQDLRDVINPETSAVFVQQTIRNARDMSANPFLYMLGDRYDDAWDAAQNLFRILAETNELILRSNATHVIPQMLTSLAEDADDIHKLLLRFQAPLHR